MHGPNEKSQDEKQDDNTGREYERLINEMYGRPDKKDEKSEEDEERE